MIYAGETNVLFYKLASFDKDKCLIVETAKLAAGCLFSNSEVEEIYNGDNLWNSGHSSLCVQVSL